MSKLDIVTVSTTFKPAAYQGGTMPAGLSLAVHCFRAAADGQLEHRIDDKHAAMIPPDGMADYALLWPECADLVRQLAPGVKLETALSKKKAAARRR